VKPSAECAPAPWSHKVVVEVAHALCTARVARSTSLAPGLPRTLEPAGAEILRSRGAADKRGAERGCFAKQQCRSNCRVR